uniref:WecB/TagA/CpsF family glycosyltransferase n=1 Tax=Desulfobacca acetoxidans TaxID=60893 RepID=A0A7V6A532_9BACT
MAISRFPASHSLRRRYRESGAAALPPASGPVPHPPKNPTLQRGLPVYSLLGVKITPGTIPQLNREISRLVARSRPGIILSANVHGLNFCRRLPWLAAFYNQADIVYVDGAGIVLGARLLGYKFPPRTTMDDWGWSAARHLARRGHSLYLLGNPPGVAAKAAFKLREHAPGLQVLGSHHGFFRKSGPEHDTVIDEINRLEPDILMVGLGMPLEQQWIMENHTRVRARVFWEVGSAFQLWAGAIPQCPRWLGNLGLNWLFRLLLEPRRLANRYLWGNTVFLAEILKARWQQKTAEPEVSIPHS